MNKENSLAELRHWAFILLRIIIGWHFLYEGITKLMDPSWSSGMYLLNTRGFLSGVFHSMASDPAILKVVDFLNIWGLILIGLGLFLGILAGIAAVSGILLLLFYYIAYIPFKFYNYGVPQEGHYLVFDKTFIEMAVLAMLLLFPSSLRAGLGSVIKNSISRFRKKPAAVNLQMDVSRRQALRNLAFLPFLGGFAWAFTSNKKSGSIDASSGSTVSFSRKSLTDIKGTMPMGVLAPGHQPVSRLIMGTNIISGTSHSRDLIYVSTLFRAYNTDKKIIETYKLAEEAGINLFYITPLLESYFRMYGKRVQTWVNVTPTAKDPYTCVDKAIEQGPDYIFVQGAFTDRLAAAGEEAAVAKCIDYIKQKGYPAGLGAHTIQAMIAAVKAGADPDFYYKTMHHDKYWSAHPRENRKPFIWSANISEDHNEFHDNMWCLFPEETIEFISTLKKPVVGFKVLAGGAIHPKVGFQWAFDNGADFIDVGMFDFQVIDNVNQAIESFEKAKTRKRMIF